MTSSYTPTYYIFPATEPRSKPRRGRCTRTRRTPGSALPSCPPRSVPERGGWTRSARLPSTYRAKLRTTGEVKQATKKKCSAGPSLKAALCARCHSGDCSFPSSFAFLILAHRLVIRDVSHLLPGFLLPGLRFHLLDLQRVCLPPPHEEVVVSNTQLKNLFQSRVKSGEKQLYT